MKQLAASILVLLMGSFLACGPEDSVPRGESTPESATLMKESEHERRQEFLQEEAKKEAEEFDKTDD